MQYRNPNLTIGSGFILEAAKAQYGVYTELWPNTMDHVFGWQAKRPNDSTRYSINIHGYSEQKYGANWRVIQQGFNQWGWAWFNPYDTANDYYILPVVFVASDHLWNVNNIHSGRDTYLHNAYHAMEWYRTQMSGKAPRIMYPHLFPSTLTSEQWRQMFVDQTNRFDTWDFMGRELRRVYNNRLNPNIIYACTAYCGPNGDWNYDAAGGGNWTSASSNCTLHRYAPTGTQAQKTPAYVLIHEVGHCLGLPHTDRSLGDATGIERAVMLNNTPPECVLVPYEKQRLTNSPFLF